jgi:hypothetical protein
MPNIPVGLSEWTNEAVNQVILESNVIQTMINNLGSVVTTIVLKADIMMSDAMKEFQIEKID